MAAGTPTLNTDLRLARSGIPRRGSNVMTVRFRSRRRIMMKYALAIQFDSSVAMPTPSTSCPRGSRTNINSGSRAMLIRPPAITPALA